MPCNSVRLAVVLALLIIKPASAADFPDPPNPLQSTHSKNATKTEHESQRRQWSVPIPGNAFRIFPAPETAPPDALGGVGRNGLRWGDEDAVYAIFFRIDRPAKLNLSLVGTAPAQANLAQANLAQATSLNIRIGKQSFDVSWPKVSVAKQDTTIRLPDPIEVHQAGYVRMEIRAKSISDQDGEHRGPDPAGFGTLRQCVVSSSTPGLNVDFVRNNDGNMFYWGRRGPSVHMTYQTPPDRSLEYGYCEITVPPDHDPIGSYFMACGFGEGYFGMQVNGRVERRILFSVWSPFSTNDPSEIPPDQRIVLLGKGSTTRVGQFGNEGSGGQSYVIYPWQAGKTYGFLIQVRPSDDGTTQYAAWFRECSEATHSEKPSIASEISAGTRAWRLVARFQRPKTQTFLTRFHSFLENFQPRFGHLERSGLWSNVWVCDVDGQWHACRRARFSVDATGGGKHRLDYSGAAVDGGFVMRNGGFFANPTAPGTLFALPPTKQVPPDIDFDALPRGSVSAD
ncbi:MAG: DUF3472 domain-containing protein [Planctomycetota bacterium]